MTTQPRLLTRPQAAAYCGAAPSTFSMWVAAGKMPPPVPGIKRWDRQAIDDKLDALSGLAAADSPESDYDKWVRESDPDYRQATVEPADALSEWREKKEKRREKHRPKMGLNANHERVLLHMADRPDLDTIDVIPGAGPSVMAHLVAVGALKRLPGDRYGLTDEGRQEVARIKKWRNLAP